MSDNEKFITLDNLGTFKNNVEEKIATKQDTLISGTNIKTINGNSLLGSDGIVVQDVMQSLTDEEIEEAWNNVPDPVLNNNSWKMIAVVCKSGKATDYWSLGATKTTVGKDGNVITYRICDMYNAYPGKVVFEQVDTGTNGYVWNYNTYKDDDNAYNNYEISDMRKNRLSVIFANYSDELQFVITPTSYIVAKNGTSSTLLTLTDKLFLPAEREIFETRTYSRQAEWDALTRFALYAVNDTADFRKKYRIGAKTHSSDWWLRSPNDGNTEKVCNVYRNGYATWSYANGACDVAPCFTLG